MSDPQEPSDKVSSSKSKNTERSPAGGFGRPTSGFDKTLSGFDRPYGFDRPTSGN
jgi:hypothetical protein